MEAPLLYRPEEAAARLRLSRSKTYELMAVGAIESVKVGGARRIPADALERFVSELRTPSVA